MPSTVEPNHFITTQLIAVACYCQRRIHSHDSLPGRSPVWLKSYGPPVIQNAAGRSQCVWLYQECKGPEDLSEDNGDLKI